MLCRAVLTVVAISYLICVLWLSGLQKEDLDVNMLRKLQRHNVNIDDMSRETLKKQCLDTPIGKDNATKQIKDKRDDDENKTTTEHVKLNYEINTKKLLEKDLKIILHDLMDTKTVKTISDKSLSFKKEVTSNIIRNSPKTLNMKHKINDILKELYPLQGDLLKKFNVQYNSDQPNIENIVNFWEMFTSTTSSYNNVQDKLRKQHHTNASPDEEVHEQNSNPSPDEDIYEQNTIKTDLKQNRSKEIDINKLIADLIDKNRKVTEKPTTASIDLNKLSDQIDKLLKLYPQSSTDIPPSNSNTIRENAGEIIENSRPNNKYFATKKTISDEGFKQSDSFIKNKKEYNDYLSTIQSIKNVASSPSRIPLLASNEKQTEMLQEYQTIKGNNYPSSKEIEMLETYKTMKENKNAAAATIPNKNLFQHAVNKNIGFLKRYQSEGGNNMRSPMQVADNKDIEMLHRYQTIKENNKVAKFPAWIPEQNPHNKEMELLQRYQSPDGHKTFSNGIPVEVSEGRTMVMLQRYQTIDKNKMATFPRIPVSTSDDKEMDMLRQYQTIEGNKITSIPEQIPVQSLDDKYMEMLHSYTIQDNNKKVTFPNRIPVQASNDQDLEMLQRYHTIDGNKITTFSKQQQNLEVKQSVNIPNKFRMQNPDKQSEMVQNYHVSIGANQMAALTNTVPAQASGDKQIKKLQRYQSIEVNKMDSYPQIISAPALDNRKRDMLQRYQSVEVNKLPFFKNTFLIQQSDTKKKSYQPIERNQIPSFLIEVPLQGPDNKQWEMFQKYQFTNKLQSESTHAPNTEITETNNNDTKISGSNMITKNCIKEIAENVKAIVLKDLRQEITATPVTTTASTTTTTATTSAVTTTVISTTTSPTTEKTTTNQLLKRPTRKKPMQNKTQEATQVMAKFMELFEQFKDKTENAINEKNTQNNVTNQDVNSLFNAKHNLVPTVRKEPYKVKIPSEDTPGFYTPFVAQVPKIIKRIPMNNVNYMHMSAMPVKPITIQTNSEEVRPLGVPLTKPFNLIHQNIVVTTTTRPTGIQRNHRNKWVGQYEHEYEVDRKETYKDFSKPISASPYLENAKALGIKPYKSKKIDRPDSSPKETKSFNPNRYDRLREFKHKFKDDTISVDKMSNNQAAPGEFKNINFDRTAYKDDRLLEFKDLDHLFKAKHNQEFETHYKRPYETSRYSNQDNKKHAYLKSIYNEDNHKSMEYKKEKGDEQKHYGDVTYSALLSRNRNERFHEKLERADDWSGTVHGKMDEVASRDQQPLYMLKDQRFDDTHFNNFLKTQQKVNEMLEKILSSKTSPISPIGVETT